MKTKQQICYITYQSFPAETANSLQTISNIKYLVKNNANVKLIFPLREKNSDDSIEKIMKYYSVNEKFRIVGVKHFLPFGKTKFLEGFFFHISHFLWSLFVTIFKIGKSKDIKYLTRSDWIFYFLAKRGFKVVFECHQTSKVRDFIIERLRNYENVKFIFLNSNLQAYYKMNDSNSEVIHNGVDEEIFMSLNNFSENKRGGLVFVGNLKRFNKNRGVEFIIEAFKKSSFLQDKKLLIVGGPEQEAQKLKDKISKLNLAENITVLGRLGRFEIAEIYKNSNIGILINSSSNQHSYEFTSPLKYFEYMYAGLKVVGVDFPSHRVLPNSSEISFFEENSISSFENAVMTAAKKKKIDNLDIKDFSLDVRAKKILKLLS